MYEKSKKLKNSMMLFMALDMAAEGKGYGKMYSSNDPVPQAIKPKKSIYRFYKDGSWTHKRNKGVVFECVAYNKNEAVNKYTEWLEHKQSCPNEKCKNGIVGYINKEPVFCMSTWHDSL